MAELIVDAGPIVAILDRREKFHGWASGQLMQLRQPLVTCDAVLTEAFYLLSRSSVSVAKLRDYLEKGLVVSRFDSMQNIQRILDLMRIYQNVPMSFADACLVCMVEKDPGSTLFTLDLDFTIYRQQRRRLIPLLAPF